MSESDKTPAEEATIWEPQEGEHVNPKLIHHGQPEEAVPEVPRVNKWTLAGLSMMLAAVADGRTEVPGIDRDLARTIVDVALDLQDTRRVLKEAIEDEECAMGGNTIDLLCPLLPDDD
jgi:hypothetical protein